MYLLPGAVIFIDANSFGNIFSKAFDRTQLGIYEGIKLFAEEAQERGHLLFHYLPNALIFSEGRVFAKGHDIKVGRGNNPVSTFYDEKIIDLGKDLDVLWLRQDPPFDMNYLTTTYLLDFVCKETLVINKPFWVRNFPEKLFEALSQ